MDQHSTPQQLALDFSTIPYGYCRCGCGRRTVIIKKSNTLMGRVRGVPNLYLRGHNALRDAEERFWEKVDKNGPIVRPELGPCHIWTATLTPSGYGEFFNGVRLVRASRFAWELVHGPFPAGLLACHHCDNRPCVRHDHIFAGSYTDNAQDAVRKGRARYGPSSGRAVLNEQKVRDIRSRYTVGLESYGTLALRYGVSPGTIGCIVKGKTWRGVR